ncbi:helix-turn-helix domain-containing protein [Thalassovita sp.]|uniref:helix-turn-helix domain-containing protein n=1 Tax=Thalassovita sp. TaxID=1979401 RepID=UPI003B63B159
MYDHMDISNRLRQARIDAGFRSASEASNRFGWTAPTYSAHENGSRAPKPKDIEKYATAFRADPCFITFGIEHQPERVAGIGDSALRQVIEFVMEHDGARTAPPREIADLIIDLCHYVSQSGEAGLGEIVNFEMRRRAAQSK